MRHIVNRIRDIWSELDYAQKRMFEIQTGVTVLESTRRRRREAEIARLEQRLGYLHRH